MSTINKINVGGTSYDIEDTTKQPLLEAGENITIENNVISASGGGGGSEPIILDAGDYNVHSTYSSNLSSISDVYGKKLIDEIQAKLVNVTETSQVFLKIKVNAYTYGTSNNKSQLLFKCTDIKTPTNIMPKYILTFFSIDNRHNKMSNNAKYNYQITLTLPQNFATTRSDYTLRYNEVQLAGRSYTPIKDNDNEMIIATRDVIFKDDTDDFTPTANTHPANKKYVDNFLTTLTGYDATKTQVLKNVAGVLTWVDEA